MSPRKRSRKNRDLPPNLGYDTKGKVTYYYYRHPITKKKTYWGPVERKKAIAAANTLNMRLLEADSLIDIVLNTTTTGETKDKQTFEHVIGRFKKEWLPNQGYSPGTLKDKEYKLNRIEADLGQYNMNHYLLSELAEWLDTNFDKNPYVKHRQVLIDLYRFAKTKGIYTHKDNPAEETAKSKKDDEKTRMRLTPEGFKAIYDYKETPQWMRDAMDLALVTLQGRLEIVKARFDDEADEHFHFIRQKTAKKTDRAFIRISIDKGFAEIISRCRVRDDHVSPYLISRKPEKKVKGHMNQRDHWTQVLPDQLSKNFKQLRDDCGFFKKMKKDQRPTFHEIRSLGADLYLQAGYSKEYVNLLLGHTTMKTTEIYLKGHRENWSECSAGLDIKKALSAK